MTGRGSRRPGGSLLSVASLVVAASLLATGARAQPTPEAVAQADQLFREGRANLAAKDYASACPKLAKSQRLDPATGTLLALAMCHEAQGLIATAWGEFRQALPAARQDNRNDRVEVATTHLARLEPRVSRLVIRLSPDARALTGLRVTRDGEPIDAGTADLVIPVDPGPHTVVVTAPGHEAWQGQVAVEEEGKRYEVTVPTLAESVGPHPTPSTPAETPPPEVEAPRAAGPAPRWIAYGLVGVGAASVVVGSVFGVRAISDSSQAKSLCNGLQCSNPHALDLNNQARSSATISNVTFGVGATALVVGAALWILSPSSPVQATAGRNGVFVAYDGSF